MNMTFEIIGMGEVGLRVGATLGLGFVEPLGVKMAMPPTTKAATTRTGARIKRTMETILVSDYERWSMVLEDRNDNEEKKTYKEKVGMVE